MPINTITNFKILTGKPVDDRLTYESYSEMAQYFATHPKLVYEGLLTFCEAENQYYSYASGEWQVFEPLSKLTAEGPIELVDNEIGLKYDNTTITLDSSGQLSTNINDHFKGWFEHIADLPATADSGDYAIVKESGSTIWLWTGTQWSNSNVVGSGVQSIITRNGGVESGNVSITPYKIGAIPIENAGGFGDMRKEVYDTDNDGIIERSDVADSIFGVNNATPNQYYGKDNQGNVGFHTINTGALSTVDWANIANKPDFDDVATTGDYNDLDNVPTLPTQLSQLYDDANHRLVTDDLIEYWNAKQDYLGVIDSFEVKVNKGIAFGYAPLDYATRVPKINLPADLGDMQKATYDVSDQGFVDKSMVSVMVEGANTTGGNKFYGTNSYGTPGFYAIVFPTESPIYELVSRKSQPNGYASLNSDGKVPYDELPALTITTTLAGLCADRPATADPNTVYICTDTGTTWLYSGSSWLAFNVAVDGSITVINTPVGGNKTGPTAVLDLGDFTNRILAYATNDVTIGWLASFATHDELETVYSVVSSVATSNPSDLKIPSEKAVRDALSSVSTDFTGVVRNVNGLTPDETGRVDLNKTHVGLGNVENIAQIHATEGMIAGTIPVWANTGTELGSGYSVTDILSISPSTDVIPSEKAVRDALDLINNITVDADISSSSVNPVQNRVIYQELLKKVDKVTGKGLSTNDFTTVLLNKLNNIADGAEVNVQADWADIVPTSDAYIRNKPGLASLGQSGFLPGYTSADFEKFLKVTESGIAWSFPTVNASNVVYDPATTELVSTNIQNAISELWLTKMGRDLQHGYAWVGNNINVAEEQRVATIPPWEANMFLKSSPVEGVFTFGTVAFDIVENPYYLRKDGGNAVEGNINWGGFLLTNLGTATVDSQAANLGVVKSQITGFYWKAPVDTVATTLPDYSGHDTGSYVAITDGYIYINTGSGWTSAFTPREANVIYNKSDKTIYFWDGSIWSKIVGLGSSSNTGVLLQDGSSHLTNYWELNDDIHNFTIQKVPNAINLTDITNKRDIVNAISALSFANSVATIETESNPVSESNKDVGYRYITYEDGTIREKIDSTTWITIDPKQGRVVYCEGDGRLYIYSGVLWSYLENIFDGSLFNLSGITVDHHNLTNIDAYDDHPRYLLTDGTRILTGNLNMGSHKITNVINATSDSDVVTFGQMKSLVNGANWIQSVTGFYDNPPTGSQFPRVIVGPNPTGDFVGYSNYIASYTMPSGPWLFSYYPATGDAVLCSAAGELNNKNDQFSFNGSEWVLFYQGQSHDNLVGADTSTIHSKYLRNDHADVAYGMITFTPTGFAYPFTVLKTGKVTNLNADRVDDYHVSEGYGSSTIVARSAAGIARSETFLTDKVIVTGDDPDTEYNPGTTQALIYTITSHHNVEGHNVHDHKLSITPSATGSTIFNLDYDYLTLNGVTLASRSSGLDAGTFNGHALSYFMPAASGLSSLLDIADVLEPEDHQILAYYASRGVWDVASVNDITSTSHHALIDLTGNDDHPQYMLTDGTRHDLLARHSYGSVVPYPRLSVEVSDVAISNPSDKQIFMYDAVSAKWVNSYVQSGIFDHEYTMNVAASIAHKEYLRIDGSYMMLGNLNIGNSIVYAWNDYKGTAHHSNELLNRHIYLGQFVDILGVTNGGWGDSEGITYSGSNALKFTIKHYDNEEHALYDKYVVGFGDAVYGGYDGFEFTREGSPVFRALYNSDLLVFNGERVWHEGMERTTGGALKGLNAELFCGKTPEELSLGAMVSHAQLIGNIHVSDYPTGNITDYHPQYLTFGYTDSGMASSNRHSNQSLHQYGVSVPKPSLNTNMTDVTVSSLGVGDFLQWDGTKWINDVINSSNIDHDNIATANSSAHDSRYYRAISSTQNIVGLFNFPKIDVDAGVGSYYVPFLIQSGCQMVPNLDADLLDGYHASAFVKSSGSETITGNKIFSSYLDATNILRIPTQDSDFIATITQDRLLFINSENGQLEYTYLDNTGQLNVIALATNGGTISGTMSEDFYIGGPAALFLYDQIKESVHGLAVKNGAGSTTFINCKDIYSDDTKIITNISGTIALDNVIIDGGVLTW